HGFAERNDLYLRHAVELAARAADRALGDAGLDYAGIDAIVAVSSSGIATPSLDALVMERRPFRRDVERLPVFGLGCAGGVLGLARAAALSLARPGSRVLLLVVELCGLTFRRADRSKSNLIASALFGDGAAAAIVSTAGGGPRLTAWGEHTWPDSLDIMGWSVADDGFGVLFSRDIPALIRRDFRSVAGNFLARHGLSFELIDVFLCHPGGAKVVDALEHALGLAPDALEDSRAVLAEFGNMSAVTVLFVLARALGRGRAGRLLLSTLGPGFTAAFLVAEAP
ncbi:MAG: type III polyketide synthase, partial [Alphaproteobacteria bacterium]